MPSFYIKKKTPLYQIRSNLSQNLEAIETKKLMPINKIQRKCKETEIESKIQRKCKELVKCPLSTQFEVVGKGNEYLGRRRTDRPKKFRR